MTNYHRSLCNTVSKAMPSLLPVDPGIKSFTTARKKILGHAEKLDWGEIHFQLTREFIAMLVQSKISINQIFPNRLLMLFNQHLSKSFIYDWNCRLYDKPHIAMSMQLLAEILGCTRNQLNYRQLQIDKNFNMRFAALQAKCEALSHAQIDSSFLCQKPLLDDLQLLQPHSGKCLSLEIIEVHLPSVDICYLKIARK